MFSVEWRWYGVEGGMVVVVLSLQLITHTICRKKDTTAIVNTSIHTLCVLEYIHLHT